MTEEFNKSIARRYIEELQNAKNIYIIDELLTEDCILHLGSTYVDREKYKSYVESHYKVFTDMHIDIIDQIAEGNKVATQWRSRFIHTQRVMNFDPTFEEVQFVGSSVHKIMGGKIVEIWIYSDRLEMINQLRAKTKLKF